MSRTAQFLGPTCPICHAKFSLSSEERPRGVVRRLFLPDLQLVKPEVLEELRVLRESSNVDASLSAKDNELKELRPKVHTLEKQLKEAETELAAEVQRAETQKQEQRAHVRVSEIKSERLERRNFDLEERLRLERKSKVDTVNQLMEEVKTVSDQLRLKDAEVKTVTDQLRRMEVEVRTVTDQLRMKEVEVRTVTDQLRTKEAEVRTVTDQLRTKEAEVAWAEWAVKDAKKDLRSLEEETDQLRKREADEIAALRSELESKDLENERNLEKLKKALLTINREYKQQGQSLDEKILLVETQQARISELERMVHSGEEDLCAKDSQLNESERIIRELENRLEIQASRSAEESQDYAEEVRRLEDEAEIYRKSLQESENLRGQLTEQLRQLQDPLRSMMSQMDELRSAHTRYQHLFSGDSAAVTTPSYDSSQPGREGREMVHCDAAAVKNSPLAPPTGGIADPPEERYHDASGQESPTGGKKPVMSDAIYVVQMAKRLTADFGYGSGRLETKVMRPPPGFVDEGEPLALSVLDLDILGESLAEQVNEPGFEDSVREIIEDHAACLAAIFQRVPPSPRPDANEEGESTVDLICAGLRLTAFLLLGKADDVRALLKRTKLIAVLSGLLRFNVKSRWFFWR